MEEIFNKGYEAAKSDYLARTVNVWKQTKCEFEGDEADTWYSGYNFYIENVHKRISSNIVKNE